MNIKQHIPNFITCLNVVAGCFAIKFTFEHNWEFVAICIGVALLADFADGFVARALKVTSEIGKELDSLADAITFALLPGLLMFQIMSLATCKGQCTGLISSSYYPYLAFMIPVFGVLRLAKFNVDTEQTFNFKGIPTPGATAFILSLVFVYLEYDLHPKFILICVVLISFLMVSDLKLIAFKFKGYSWRENWEKYVFAVVSVFLLLIFRLQAFFIIIPVYVLLSSVYFYLLNKDEK